ncbi:inhibitor of vertebrate lysozyme family protein [Serratia entomophila]|uniref:Inhibitor of vertebrate lysozyme family protein n=1 Tax=Serratia entomophila TaxID=42906 RepID=A0ABY5CR20_9GAMM|nr:inhibitor of vertebrate lysozyme family protein [Serratia entomophila]USU99857.1 inhibitor of vertebrate lysozyme family protein [Serratia entomophila]CAI0895595.1 Inhibitor of vertebrate lysozyme precursor [Serratia entomophila]CAI0897897.1 Inhibitor of vertebrate lysozyme precursor [Serratia entomophila]CAI0921605.1 Inhibitor of vertebrate lysozyme precursor [Serratia entomophila]CAI0923932.1 Inhibitor of vertebrate lysozyme precursor [Serratia entomophila]
MAGQCAPRSAVFGALLSFSAGGFAQQIVTTSDVIQQPGYQASWQNMVKGQARLPGWARKGAGTSTPVENLSWQGQDYLIGNLCKPHDCANNFLIVAFKEDKSQAWAVRVEVENRPAAIDHPKKYASYQWLGKPNDDIKALLKKQFEDNPDWQ